MPLGQSIYGFLFISLISCNQPLNIGVGSFRVGGKPSHHNEIRNIGGPYDEKFGDFLIPNDSTIFFIGSSQSYEPEDLSNLDRQDKVYWINAKTNGDFRTTKGFHLSSGNDIGHRMIPFDNQVVILSGHYHIGNQLSLSILDLKDTIISDSIFLGSIDQDLPIGDLIEKGNELILASHTLEIDSFKTDVQTYGLDHSDIFLTGIESGNLSQKWQSKFGFTGRDWAISIQAIESGKLGAFAVLANTEVPQQNDSLSQIEIAFFITNDRGTPIRTWLMSSPNPQNDEIAVDMLQQGESFMLLGLRRNNAHSLNGSITLWEVNPSTNSADLVQVNVGLGGNPIRAVHSISAYPSGGYVVLGTCFNIDNQSLDLFLVQIDESGREQWYQLYGGSGDDYGGKVLVHQGYIYLTGTFAFGKETNTQIGLLKTDLFGNLNE